MCGIGGQFAYGPRGRLADPVVLARMSQRMRARGPDSEGSHVSEDCRLGLVHRRLAILDLSPGGHQPMHDPVAGTAIVFNGEIYNYRELKARLIEQGHRFRSQSDTEVLLHLYAEHGPAMLDMLRGMYAIAIWDSRRRGLLLARDPFGIKPLYIADDGHTLRFASQVKALLATGEIETGAREPAAVAGFFMWGHIPEPFTLYKSIRALPAGSCLWIEAEGSPREQSFFHVARRMETLEPLHEAGSLEGAREILAAALRDSVRHHLVSDVPVGVFLSSGLDSCTLLALAAEAKADPPVSLTLAFKEFEGTAADEAPLARTIAELYGADARVRSVSADDFNGALEHLIDAMDQPSIDGVNTYFVCRAAREAGLKVALSGAGGDELLGGYMDFARIPRLVGMLSAPARVPGLGGAFRRLSAPLLKRLDLQKYASLVELGGTYSEAYLLCRALFLPWELDEVLDPASAREGLAALATEAALRDTLPAVDDPHLKVSALVTSWYLRNQLLRDSDWASMCFSLELRTPLVDVALWETTVRLALAGYRAGKQDMALSPARRLPQEVLDRPKTGFSIPVREWLTRDDTGRSPSAAPGLRGWSKLVAARFDMVAASPVRQLALSA